MLTSLQHQFAPCLPSLQERRAYTTHMCGLCHALGARYGLLSRLVTSHELILLNLLTSAQRPDEPATIKRQCPLNPLRTVATNQDISSEFAAAVAIKLANVKFGDDIQDSGGRDVAARLARWLARKPHQTALRVLSDLGFNVEILDRLGERQTLAEKNETQDPAGPSALASAELFAMTARLGARPDNADLLALIGANVGAHIYLLDAYRDFARDLARGDYNPLRRFCQHSAEALTLSHSGLGWLRSRIQMIQSAVRENVPKLHLYRHHDLLVKLLCGPVDRAALELSRRVQRPELTFRRRPWVDALKAGLFILPAAELETGLAGTGLTRVHTKRRRPGRRSDHARQQEHGGPCDYSGPCRNWSGAEYYYCNDCNHLQCGELPNCSPEGCGQADGGKIDCPHVDRGGTDCGSCGGVDLGHCGGVDLSHCSGVDLGHCSGVDLSHCSGVDCSHCSNVDLSGCSGMDCSHCSNVDLSGCGNVDLSGCGGADCGGCGS